MFKVSYTLKTVYLSLTSTMHIAPKLLVKFYPLSGQIVTKNFEIRCIYWVQMGLIWPHSVARVNVCNMYATLKTKTSNKHACLRIKRTVILLTPNTSRHTYSLQYQHDGIYIFSNTFHNIYPVLSIYQYMEYWTSLQSFAKYLENWS